MASGLEPETPLSQKCYQLHPHHQNPAIGSCLCQHLASREKIKLWEKLATPLALFGVPNPLQARAKLPLLVTNQPHNAFTLTLPYHSVK